MKSTHFYKILFTVGGLFISTVLFSQAIVPTATENYVHVIEPSEPNTVADGISQGIRTIQYFDGLGRPKQVVMSKATTSGVDMIIHYEYDGFGRQVKDYLPVRTGLTDGKYVMEPIDKYEAFYGNTNTYDTDVYYSEKEIEDSPLNRVMKQAAPGDAWELGSGHEIGFEYLANTTDDQVLIFTVESNGNLKKKKDLDADTVLESYYLNGLLYKMVTTDENGNDIEEYKNKTGQVILKRTYVLIASTAEERGVPNPGGLVKSDTYYVYDIYGNLTYVIPPLLSALYYGSNDLPLDWGDKMNELGYVYRYDERNRLVDKKLPGKDWEYMEYDKQDRLVATQDANLRVSNQWLFTKYDKFGRIVYTGINTGSRSSIRTQISSAGSNNEQKNGTGFTQNGITVYYTKTAFPTTVSQVFSVNYYDNYENFSLRGMTAPTESLDESPIRSGLTGADSNNSVKGMLTASFVQVLGMEEWESTYNFYDSKSRPVDVYKVNYLDGFTKVRNILNFRGAPTQVHTFHKRSSASSDPEIKTVEKFTYDTQGRLTKHTHKVGNKPEELMALNTYDQLGQLISKKVGSSDLTGAGRLQNVDYKYNIRGWLTDINDVELNLTADRSEPSENDDLFAFRIQYNTLDFDEGLTGSPADPLFNGNIAQTFWRSSSDNLLRGYSYEYDQLNRLRNASFAKVTLDASFFPGAYDENIAYDLNGNITKLTRYTGDATLNQINMDNLTYTYLGNNGTSNKLMKVTDGVSGSSTGGFSNGSSGTSNDYTYDDNGNMTSDLNKGISSILYNYLNLPEYIEFANGNAIEYLYNAAGQKVRKKVVDMTSTPNGTIKEVDYLDGFQYAGGILQFFPTTEGYVSATKSNSLQNPYIYNYVYNYTDHLGNIRLSYTQDPLAGISDPLEIMEENHYYPFGLKHSVYTGGIKQRYQLVEEEQELARPGFVYETDYMYKYNGKEWQDELGLNLYDYGFRNYDPALGRWMNIDPLAEKYPQMTPYNYAANTPTLFVDYDGKDFGLNIDHKKKTIKVTATYYFDSMDSFNENKYAISDWNKLEGTYIVDGVEYSVTFDLKWDISGEGEDAKQMANDDPTGNYIGEIAKDKDYGKAFREAKNNRSSNFKDWGDSGGFTFNKKFIYNRSSVANDQTRAHEIGHTLGEDDSKTQVGVMAYKESFSLMENVTIANGMNIIQRAFNLADKQKSKTNSLHQPYSHKGPTSFNVIGQYQGSNFLGGTLNLNKK